MLIFILLSLFVLILVISNISIVPQSYAYIIERLGVYSSTWNEGLNIKIPFIDRIVKIISLKEKVLDFPPQPVITKDNVTIQIDTVVYAKIIDPKLYTYGIENPVFALENLTATTLRNIIGELELDETLTGRDLINAKMQKVLDEATDPWGIKVTRVEVKNINPPRAIQEAMEKQMKAERERREQILIAEGHKKSAILEAEGKKGAMILEAEGKKAMLVLEAEAEKQAKIEKAKGEAEAILEIQKSMGLGIEILKKAGSDEIFLKLKSLEAFENACKGSANKIIIPSDVQNLAGFLASIKELMKK